jgi:hypothetical protein
MQDASERLFAVIMPHPHTHAEVARSTYTGACAESTVGTDLVFACLAHPVRTWRRVCELVLFRVAHCVGLALRVNFLSPLAIPSLSLVRVSRARFNKRGTRQAG